jgi:hypothetical protein
MPARKPDREITRWTTQKGGKQKEITLVAIHESVGITNAWDLVLFCERKGVSYHDVVDLTQIIHAVPFGETAWHIRGGNSRAVGLCLSTPTPGYGTGDWLGPQVAKVEYAAWWIARACYILGLPIRHCSFQQLRSALQGNKADGGVITHRDYTLATGDGTHTDPRDFPMDMCLDWARGISSSAPSGVPPWPLPRDHYFGLITGPSQSHGGYYESERSHIKAIQRALIRKGYVPGVSNPASGWVDGIYEQPTADAVSRFQHAEMPNTQFYGQVWWDDWQKLLS